MLEDDTDIYLSTGPDFIEPMIRKTSHVMESNDKIMTTQSVSRNNDVQHGQVGGGGGLPVESIGVVLEPIPGIFCLSTHPPHPLFFSTLSLANPAILLHETYGIVATGYPNMVLPTGQIQTPTQTPTQATTPTQEIDVPCRSHQVNFSSSTKESLLDDVSLPQDSTESTVPITVTSVPEATVDSSFIRLDVVAPLPVKPSSRHHLVMDDSSIITDLASESADSLASSSPTAKLSEIASTSTSPAVGKTGKRKEYVRNDRSSFSGSLDLDRLKVYVKQNGEYNALFEEENPGKGLVVERNWSFQEFLTFAGRKIGMPNASRVFTRLGTDVSIFPHLSLNHNQYSTCSTLA